MAVSLTKGQKVDLTKGNPGLNNLLVGLGWDINKFDGGSDFDLDTAAFMLGADGKTASDADFVFYGNLKHASGGVEHLGDNLTGEGEGDDEEIKMNLLKKLILPLRFTKPRNAARTLARFPMHSFGLLMNPPTQS